MDLARLITHTRRAHWRVLGLLRPVRAAATAAGGGALRLDVSGEALATVPREEGMLETLLLPWSSSSSSGGPPLARDQMS